MNYGEIKPEHILDAAKTATCRVLRRWYCLRPYADEVASESLVAATKAAKRYPKPSLLFTYGLKYTVDRIIRAMKVQKWWPDPDKITIRPWSLSTEGYKYINAGVSIPIESTNEELLAKMSKVLNPRSVDMVWRRVVEGETLQSIADSYGISRQATWEAIEAAKEKLKCAWASQAIGAIE